MTTGSPDLASAFIAHARDYLGVEYRTKLRLAIEAMPADNLWWRPNEQSNSVGNLLMHLNGNIRQWIVGGVDGAPNTRDRADEFAAREGASAAELLANLDRMLDEVDRILARLTADTLLQDRCDPGTRRHGRRRGRPCHRTLLVPPGPDRSHFENVCAGRRPVLRGRRRTCATALEPVVAAATGFTIKSGWASAVLLAGPARTPAILDSRRVELSDPDVPAAKQPYHAGFGTARKPGDERTRLLASVRRFGKRSVAGVLR